MKPVLSSLIFILFPYTLSGFIGLFFPVVELLAVGKEVIMLTTYSFAVIARRGIAGSRQLNVSFSKSNAGVHCAEVLEFL